MVDRIWRVFKSMRLGIMLLILFAGISMVGTFIPQKSLDPMAASGVNPIWQALGLTDIYGSPLYHIVVALLMLNLLVCSINRLPGTMRRYKSRPTVKTAQEIELMPTQVRQGGMSSLEKARIDLERVLKARRYVYVQTQENGSWAGWAYKGRLGVWGAFLVHLSFLVLVLGTVLGHLGGFKGYFMINEGATVPLQGIQMEAGQIQSDWNIKINSAVEKFNAQGQRDNWYTDVSILQNNKEIKRQVLSVNNPLIYQGITFYQTSFANGVSLNYNQNGQMVPFALQSHGQNWYRIPETSLYVVADTLGVKNGHMVLNYLVLSPESQAPIETGTLLQGERVKIQGRYDIGLNGPVAFTGLLVKKDPGVPVVWSGCALLLVGLVLAFYLKRQRVWFAFEESGASGESGESGRPGKEIFLSLGVHSDAGAEHSAEILNELLADWEKGKGGYHQ